MPESNIANQINQIQEGIKVEEVAVQRAFNELLRRTPGSNKNSALITQLSNVALTLTDYQLQLRNLDPQVIEVSGVKELFEETQGNLNSVQRRTYGILQQHTSGGYGKVMGPQG